MNPERFSTGLVDESEIKTPRFGGVSGDFESESKVGTLNLKTFESEEFCCVNNFLSNTDIFPPATFEFGVELKWLIE